MNIFETYKNSKTVIEDNISKYYRDKNVLVVGLSYRSGISAVRLLDSVCANIYISDSKKDDNIKGIYDQISALVKKAYFGKQEISQLENIDLIVLSPGVPRSIPLIKSAVDKGIIIKSEIELGSDLFAGQIIAVTGTDGKSTTVSLVYSILKEKYKTFLGGNIGIPFTDIVLNNETENTVAVLELSSFQLESLNTFHSGISLFLNFARDHLNRYEDMTAYFRAKCNIFINQNKNDHSLINFDYERIRIFADNLSSDTVFFSSRNKIGSGFYFVNDDIYFNSERICSIKNVQITGIHNRENILAAVSIAVLSGVEGNLIEKTVSTFKGLPHRNEFVRKIGDISFINDSKGTTINAVKSTLSSYNGSIALIAGGASKGDDFSHLKSTVDEKVFLLILIGTAKEEMAEKLKFKNTIFAESMKRAVNTAYEKLNEGIIILSPACTSYDMYTDFEERGNDFKKYVNEISVR